MRHQPAYLLFALILLVACGGNDRESPEAEAAVSAVEAQDTFWESLQSLCGLAFAGTVIESYPPDTSFSQQTMVMQVRECEEGIIRIPFHVGENRSRTWVISRTPSGLRLKHDHRHEDGSEDEVTMYGGDTVEPGTVNRQEFPADSLTAAMIPTSATNIWTLEITPNETFVYDLRRTGSDRRVRVEFDLTEPIPTPLPPWGS